MKNLKIIILLLLSNFTFSQIDYAFILEDSNGNQIADQSTLQFSSIEYPDASFNFYTRNLTNESIRLKAEVISMSGTDGSSMEFCFGECYYSVDVGLAYPIGGYVTVQAGETQISTGDHFFNQNPGDGENPVEFSFRFFMVDENGDEVVSIPELQTDYFINYYYSSSLNLDDIDYFNLIYYLQGKNIIIKINSPTNLKIYDIAGKLIYSKLLEQGLNSIDMYDLKQKKIILSFETPANNKISTKKIILP